MLWNMEQGQQVAIERENGEYLYYEATSVDFFPNDKVPEYVLNMESDTAKITFIICYGGFDYNAGTSKERCVVVCKIVD